MLQAPFARASSTPPPAATPRHLTALPVGQKVASATARKTRLTSPGWCASALSLWACCWLNPATSAACSAPADSHQSRRPALTSPVARVLRLNPACWPAQQKRVLSASTQWRYRSLAADELCDHRGRHLCIYLQAQPGGGEKPWGGRARLVPGHTHPCCPMRQPPVDASASARVCFVKELMVARAAANPAACGGLRAGRAVWMLRSHDWGEWAHPQHRGCRICCCDPSMLHSSCSVA